jgi:protein arginine kinase
LSRWYIDKGPQGDVAVSSRVRLARNFENIPFHSMMDEAQALEVENRVKKAFLEDSGKKYSFIDMQDIDPVNRQVLVEKHLISPNLAERRRGSAVILSDDESISVMVNEEDHLRIQCMFPGLQLEKAWELCDRIDVFLEERIDYAFDKELGYLTCCPTNIGTGMRASVMLHLPALIQTGYIKDILDACAKLGAAARGVYGEHSEAWGNMVQISNQITLGLSENEIIKGIDDMVSQIIGQERMIRKKLYDRDPLAFEDKVYRSLGILRNARVISFEESVRLLSDVKLGISMGIISDISDERINEVMLCIQPANLQKAAGIAINNEVRDAHRAEAIRKKLNSI